MGYKGRDAPPRNTGPPRSEFENMEKGQVSSMETRQIGSVSSQLVNTAMNISSLAESVSSSPELEEVYDELLLDEVKHVQILALELTKLVAEEGRADDGVFAEGDLNSTIGKEKDDEE